MEKQKSGYERFVESPSRRRLVEQESLILEAAELVFLLMTKEGVKRAELARRLGRSKAYVTQVLRGTNNLTLRTLADLGDALGYRFRMLAKNIESGHCLTLPDVPRLHVNSEGNLLACWSGLGKTSKETIREQQPNEENNEIWKLSA